MSELEQIARRIPKVWEVYTNPYLREQIEALSFLEKVEVDELVRRLIEDAPLFHVFHTKPHASQEEYGIDHVSYGVWNNIGLPNQDVPKYLFSLGENLGSILSLELRLTCESPTFSDRNVIRILPFPKDATTISEEHVIIKADFETPGNTAVYDNRQVHNGYVLIVQADSPIVSFLRSGNNARLFSFVLRNAAVVKDTHSAVYFDVPLEKKEKQALAVVDLTSSPRKFILWYDTAGFMLADRRDELPDDKELYKYAKAYGVATSELRDPKRKAVEIYPTWPQSQHPERRVYDFKRVERILAQT